MSTQTSSVKVWDLPTRIFHWSLAICVPAAVITQGIGGEMMEWHGRLGLTILGLLSFRIVWGFVGSTHARFCSFVRGPGAIQSYLEGAWKGLGHNPLGALSVLGLLAVLLLQASTGLFAHDDIDFQGPLYALVGSNISSAFKEVHEGLAAVMFFLIIAHLSAIVYYVKVKKDNLVIPMITGKKEVASEDSYTDAKGGGPIAFIFALLIALAVVYAASGAFVPKALTEQPKASPQQNW